MRFGVSTLFYFHIIWLQSTASGTPLSRFTENEKCIHVKDSWKNGSTSSTPTQARFIEKALAKTKEDMLTVSKRSGYLRKVYPSIPLCVFASLAPCQWRRGWSRQHPGGSGVRQIEEMTESPQKYGCLQDMLGVTLWASMNDAFSTAMLGVGEGRRGELLGKEALARVIYPFPTYCGELESA